MGHRCIWKDSVRTNLPRTNRLRCASRDREDSELLLSLLSLVDLKLSILDDIGNGPSSSSLVGQAAWFHSFFALLA